MTKYISYSDYKVAKTVENFAVYATISVILTLFCRLTIEGITMVSKINNLVYVPVIDDQTLCRSFFDPDYVNVTMCYTLFF